MIPTLIHGALPLVLLLSPATLAPMQDAGDAVEANLNALRDQARKLLAAGDAAAARPLLEQLHDQLPDDAAITAELGRACLAAGDPAGAVAHLTRAQRAMEPSYDLHLEIAEALLAQARAAVWAEDYQTAGYAFMDARRFFEEASALAPTEASPLVRAAAVERERGDPEAALELVDRALEVDAKDAEGLLLKGSLLYARILEQRRAGDQAGAKSARAASQEAYELVLEHDPQNGLAKNGLAWLAWLDGDEAKAEQLFAESLRADPTVADSYRQLEVLLADDKEERQRLVELLDGVVRSAATFASGDARRDARALAYYQRGRARAQNRQVAEMTRDFEECAKLQPAYAAACRFQTARGLYRDYQYDEAARVLIAMAAEDMDSLLACLAGERDPNDAALLVRGLADQMARKNQLADARELFGVAAQALATSANDWNNYAFFCRETGEYEQSYEAYCRALELAPDDPALLNDTALILQYHLGRDLDRAAELYEAAIVEAQRVLEDGAADSNAQESARIALRDASNNLRLLRRKTG